MIQRNIQIITREGLRIEEAVVSTVSVKFASDDGGSFVADYTFDSPKLTDEQIAEATQKLLMYYLPAIPADEMEIPAKGVTFKRTPDGKWESA